MVARNFRAVAMLCAVAVPLSFYVYSSSPADARHRSHVASKHKAGKHGRQKSAKDQSDSDDSARSENPALEAHTPVDKHDCINVSQIFYRRAASVAARTKHAIPKEFERVASNLDVFCGEEEFEKARVTIDWMNTCLQNFTQDSKLGYCSRKESYFCAIEPGSESCRSNKADQLVSESPGE